MDFKELKIYNFRAINELHLNFDVSGITVIRGKNGVGKTTIIDALFFALYGKSIKNTVKESIIPKNSKNKDVDVFLSVGDILIHRTLNSCTIIKDNEELNLINIDATNKFIEEYIGCSSKIFLNTIVFGQNMLRFLESSDSDKKILLEEIFEQISFVRDMNDVCQTHVTDLRAEANSLKNKLFVEKSILDSLDVSTVDHEYIDKIEHNVKVLQDMLVTYPEQDLSFIKINLKNVDDRRFDILRLLGLDEVCPTCGQELINKEEIILLKAQKASEIESLDILRLELIKEQTEKEGINIENKNIKTRIKELNIEMKTLKDRIVRDDQSIEEKVLSITKKIEDLKIQISEVAKSLIPHEWWLDEGFGSKGLKEHMINDLLNKINKHLSLYCQITQIPIILEYDANKSRKGFNVRCFKEGKELNYLELSGGEKNRANMSVSFAIHDILNSINGYNLLFLDECFENLDEEGLFSAIELLRTKADKYINVFVITHRNDIDVLNVRTIELIRNNDKIYFNE